MSSPRFCSECGKPLEADHCFCTNCGATTSAEADARTKLTSDHTVLANDQPQSPQSQVSASQVTCDATASTIITPNAKASGAANIPGFTPVMPNASLSNFEKQIFLEQAIQRYQHRITSSMRKQRTQMLCRRLVLSFPYHRRCQQHPMALRLPKPTKELYLHRLRLRNVQGVV